MLPAVWKAWIGGEPQLLPPQGNRPAQFHAPSSPTQLPEFVPSYDALHASAAGFSLDPRLIRIRPQYTRASRGSCQPRGCRLRPITADARVTDNDSVVMNLTPSARPCTFVQQVCVNDIRLAPRLAPADALRPAESCRRLGGASGGGPQGRPPGPARIMKENFVALLSLLVRLPALWALLALPVAAQHADFDVNPLIGTWESTGR